MVTRKVLTPAHVVALGLFAGLLAQHANAADEVVVYGPAAVGVRAEQAVLRSELEQYNRELKLTLTEELRDAMAPKVIVLASNENQARG
jgi:hypothetical protein